MKKKNFFGGLTASLALATFALTTVTLTSCEKESFSVTAGKITSSVTTPETTVNAADAKAQINITVVDWDNGQILLTSSKTLTDVSNAQTVTVECPDLGDLANQYLSVDPIEVDVPALGKGQAVVIPITFYVQSVSSAAEKIGSVEVEGSKTTTVGEAVPFVIADDIKISTEDRTNVTIENVITYAGQEIAEEDLKAAYAIIDALFPETETRAYTNLQKRNIMKALVDAQNTGIKEVKNNVTLDKVPANEEIIIKVTTTYEEFEKSITATLDGSDYTVPVKIRRVENSKIDAHSEAVEENNGHDGHDGHGDNENAGGGTTEKA